MLKQLFWCAMTGGSFTGLKNLDFHRHAFLRSIYWLFERFDG